MTAQVQERVTADDIERAYQDMMIAADLVELGLAERMPRHVIEKRQEDMHSANARLDRLQEMRLEQAEAYPFEPTLELQIERER